MINILVADDHAILRKGIILILKDEYPDVNIGEANNGAELIELCNNQKWDLVISDIGMPGRNGIDTLKYIKDLYPTLPFLMLSMYPEDQYAVRALKGGASGYMTKESAPNELINAVRSILSGRKYITTSIAEKIADQLGNKNPGTLHERLSDREMEVLISIASGKTITEIADSLSLSATTISTYRTRILEKMYMKTNSELTNYAFSNKLV